MEITIIINVNEEKDKELTLWPDWIWRESEKDKIKIMINKVNEENKPEKD